MKERLFAENVNRLMLQNELTQTELARLTHISRGTVSNVLSKIDDTESNAPTSLKLSTAVSIANGLCVELPLLFSRVETIESQAYFQPTTLKEYVSVFITNVKFYLKGRSQKGLSYAEGVSESTLSEIFSGLNKDPYVSTLEHISSALQIDLASLLNKEEK